MNDVMLPVEAAVWPLGLAAPVLSGIRPDVVADRNDMPRLEPGLAPPCAVPLWRLECADGQPIDARGLLARYWHRRPYAVTLRLACYPPTSTVAEILDEVTIGTTGSWNDFRASVDRMAMRLVKDAVQGGSRGASADAPAVAPSGPTGWLQRWRRTWRDRLTSEWWSLGSVDAPPEALLSDALLRDIRWYAPQAGERYLADPFPHPGTGTILCEEMPRIGGIGRIVAVTRAGDRRCPSDLCPSDLPVLDDGLHHSYPCTFAAGETVYCVPETPIRGGTLVHILSPDRRLTPIAEVAPDARLADPTLFRYQDKWWIACTDLDIGPHDNLCLLHALSPEGPWRRHDKWPVKIDVRGSRPAGSVVMIGGRLIRPAQDCAEGYGAAIALNEVTCLTETTFREVRIGTLRPDPNGPFPNGLHTLTHDGERFWVDGKRIVFDLAGKLDRKLSLARRGRKEH